MLLRHSVKPTCDPFATTTFETPGSLIASITPRRYSARPVSQRPGSALASGDSMRQASAHSLTVMVDGGAMAASVLATRLCRTGGNDDDDDACRRALERWRSGNSCEAACNSFCNK